MELIDLCDAATSAEFSRSNSVADERCSRVDLEEGEVEDDPQKRQEEENMRIREQTRMHIAKSKERAEAQRKRYQEYLAKRRWDPRLNRSRAPPSMG